MAVYKTSNSGLLTRTQYSSFLAGNEQFIPSYAVGAYDSIATTTVGVGGVSSVTFSSIPQTYTHLQIRAITRDTGGTSANGGVFQVQFNSDNTSGSYRTHSMIGYGNGTTSSFTTASSNRILIYGTVYSTVAANVFGANIVDILDYTNTNKNKVVRNLSGWDDNSTGESAGGGGMWINTSAVTSVTVYMFNANLAQYSSIALYGIKGA